MKVLVTCPPMLRSIDRFRPIFADHKVELLAPPVVQTLSEEELMDILPGVDGWIIGDDPATERVFAAGRAGRLKAAVKWGVGVDNVDFAACRKLGIPITNTPGMFGDEVGDLAIGYLIGLARDTFYIDRGVREGQWPKPPGLSLRGCTVALVGLGDIGKAVARKLPVFGVTTIAYDPFCKLDDGPYDLALCNFPERLGEADFIIVTCALTPETRHLINADTLAKAKPGVRVINVSRGPVIDEAALIEALQSGQVSSAALDVFEEEPLPISSPLRQFPRCIFGTHNGSNTLQAVDRTSHRAIDLLFGFLKID